MSYVYGFIGCVVIMGISYLAGRFQARAKDAEALSAARAARDLATKEAADLTELVRQLTSQLNDSTARNEQILAAGREQLATERRRADEHRTLNEAVLQQRDQWQGLYEEQSVAHGNAQAIMMDAIGFLERKLRDHGVEVTLPPVVKETQELYRDRHVTPVLQRTDRKMINRGSQDPDNVLPAQEST